MSSSLPTHIPRESQESQGTTLFGKSVGAGNPTPLLQDPGTFLPPLGISGSQRQGKPLDPAAGTVHNSPGPSLLVSLHLQRMRRLYNKLLPCSPKLSPPLHHPPPRERKQVIHKTLCICD